MWGIVFESQNLPHSQLSCYFYLKDLIELVTSLLKYDKYLKLLIYILIGILKFRYLQENLHFPEIFLSFNSQPQTDRCFFEQNVFVGSQ